MTLRVHRSTRFLAACGYRLPGILCCILTLWSGIDSQVIRLLQTSSGSMPAPFQNPLSSQENNDDDDDYVLDLTEKPAPGRNLRNLPNGIRPSSPGLFCFAPANFCLSPSTRRRRPPMTPFCELECRNGIGAYLLC